MSSTTRWAPLKRHAIGHGFQVDSADSVDSARWEALKQSFFAIMAVTAAQCIFPSTCHNERCIRGR
jgi:hypothetical protein